MNIIADIAGQYDALLRLVDKMPKGPIYTLGDLNDRGPNSKEVIQWAIDNDVNGIIGNHEHMMLDFYRGQEIYDPNIWHWNGGAMTAMQYDDDIETRNIHLNWIESLPPYLEVDGVFMSHAAWSDELSIKDACDLSNIGSSIIWNRGEPIIRDTIQIMGHNSHWGLRYFGEKEKPWAICLDASRSGVVTGMHWPSMKIYQEPYLRGRS